MALNADVLGSLIRTKVEALSADDVRARDPLFKAIAEALIEHITSAGLVTVTVVSVSGVTSGAGVSGPGTGTGTIS